MKISGRLDQTRETLRKVYEEATCCNPAARADHNR